MDNNPIENLMKTTMESIRQMVDVNIIVGDPVESKGGITIIPISKVCFGFASGGSEFDKKSSNDSHSKLPFGGGAGAGVTVKPVAFIVINNETIKLLPVEYDNTYDKAIDSIPQILETIKNMSRPKNEKCSSSKESKD